MVAALTTPFRARHPAVRFSVQSATSHEITRQIANLELDAGLTYIEDEPLGRVTALPLYREHYRLLTAADGIYGARASVTWAEVGRIPLCLLTPAMQNRRIINRNLIEAGVTPQATVESSSTVVLVAHVLEGGWITILPEDIAAFLTQGKPLRMIPLDGAGASHAVGLVAPWREPHTPVLEALLAEARGMAIDR